MKDVFSSHPKVCRDGQTLGHLQALALNRKQAAEALGISAVTLDRLVARGFLRPSRACRRPLFSIRELERFLQMTTTSEAFVHPKEGA
jgi:hypothetical protein